MPTYEYVCKSCGHGFEVWQSFSDDALTTCEECGGPLRKVFGNVGITFKGRGFYKTDSRKSTGSDSGSSASSDAGSSSSSSSKSDSGSGGGHGHGGHSHSHGSHSHTH